MSEALNIRSADDEDIDALRAALIGRSVVAVRKVDGPKLEYGINTEGEVILDNGDVLRLAGNVGGCSCSAGDYELTALNDMPINGITNVEVAYEDVGADLYEPDGVYRIFVLAFGGKFELARFDGGDGNGSYGTGFWMQVVKPEVGRV